MIRVYLLSLISYAMQEELQYPILNGYREMMPISGVKER